MVKSDLEKVADQLVSANSVVNELFERLEQTLESSYIQPFTQSEKHNAVNELISVQKAFQMMLMTHDRFLTIREKLMTNL